MEAALRRSVAKTYCCEELAWSLLPVSLRGGSIFWLGIISNFFEYELEFLVSLRIVCQLCVMYAYIHCYIAVNCTYVKFMQAISTYVRARVHDAHEHKCIASIAHDGCICALCNVCVCSTYMHAAASYICVHTHVFWLGSYQLCKADRASLMRT